MVEPPGSPASCRARGKADAPKLGDFREMLEKMGDRIDAVVVARRTTRTLRGRPRRIRAALLGPVREVFAEDDEANARLERPMRKPFQLPDPA